MNKYIPINKHLSNEVFQNFVQKSHDSDFVSHSDPGKECTGRSFSFLFFLSVTLEGVPISFRRDRLQKLMPRYYRGAPLSAFRAAQALDPF